MVWGLDSGWKVGILSGHGQEYYDMARRGDNLTGFGHEMLHSLNTYMQKRYSNGT